jgi:hypothetical protein
MLLNQNTIMVSSSTSYAPRQSRLLEEGISSIHNRSLVLPTRRKNTKVRQEWIRSPLNRFGIYQRRTTKYMRIASGQPNSSEQETDHVISDCYDSIVSCGLLGYACQWSRQHPYGNILPSLRVYPLVNDIWLHLNLIKDGTIEEIEQAFRSGVLHPFTVDPYGRSLLCVRLNKI